MKFNVVSKALALSFAVAVNAIALPNLTPYQPAGWSDKIVVARTTGTTTDATGLTTADSLYVSWAVANFGDASTGTGFLVYLYVDGVFKVTFNSGAIPNSSYTYAPDY